MGYDKNVGDVSRHQRVIKRNLEQLFTQKEDEAAATNIEEPKIISTPTTENLEDIDVDFTTVLQTHFTNTNSQTDITSNMLGLKEEEYVRTNSHLYMLQDELKLLRPGMREWYIDDNKVKFYTGLPNIEIMDALFIYISDSITSTTRSALSKFQMLSLTLMRIRLDLSINDLAYRFNISSSTVSSIFLKIIDILFVHLKPIIKWPERDQIWKTTPMCFRKHFGTK